MNYYYDPGENERVASARDSFSGVLLTDAQFEESLAITHIIEREIKTSGSFKEKLGDYAFAFARTEKFDAMKSETILRDIFKERTGQSMNDMRQALMEREEKLTPEQTGTAHEYAVGVGDLIENGYKMTFHRAYAHQAGQLANELKITDAGAKRLMRDEFKAVEGSELYEWGKELEEKFYRPQVEAEKQERKQAAEERRAPTRARTRSMELRR